MGLSENLAHFEDRCMFALSKEVDNFSTQLENAMKEKKYAQKPWINHTFDAMNRLSAKPSKNDTGFVITLSHGVEYGVYLELAHEQKYAVIKPTIRAEAPRIMRTFQGMLERMDVSNFLQNNGGGNDNI